MKYKEIKKNKKDNIIIINFNKPLEEEKYQDFLKTIHKLRFICRKKVNIYITIDNKDINISKEKDQRVINLYHIEQALNIKNKKERYEYIYDVVCDYLDDCFRGKNLCEFKDDKCLGDRNKKFEKSCGCCNGKTRGTCKYLVNGSCSIKCMGCKLFTCPSLRKKGIKFRIKDIPLLHYFFNLRQKEVLAYTIFTPKDEVIERLIKFRW